MQQTTTAIEKIIASPIGIKAVWSPARKAYTQGRPETGTRSLL